MCVCTCEEDTRREASHPHLFVTGSITSTPLRAHAAVPPHRPRTTRLQLMLMLMLMLMVMVMVMVMVMEGFVVEEET